MTVRGYRDLDVWKRSVSFVTAVYAATQGFPKEELYGLTSQIRRSAVSVPSNIAEGRAKRTTKDFIRFLNIAYGSMAELETQLLIASNLGFLKSAALDPLLDEASQIARMINGMRNGLEKNMPASQS